MENRIVLKCFHTRLKINLVKTCHFKTNVKSDRKPIEFLLVIMAGGERKSFPVIKIQWEICHNDGCCESFSFVPFCLVSLQGTSVPGGWRREVLEGWTWTRRWWLGRATRGIGGSTFSCTWWCWSFRSFYPASLALSCFPLRVPFSFPTFSGERKEHQMVISEISIHR